MWKTEVTEWATLRRMALWALLASTLLTPVQAVEIHGSARVWTGITDTNGSERNDEDQAFHFSLSQDLSPWLNLFGSYRATTFRSGFDLAPVFEQSSEEPEIGLVYDRPTFNARLAFSDRAIRSSDESQDLDLRSFLANLEWRPKHGPRFGLRYQDTNSIADPAVFGRETATEALDLRLDYTRSSWNTRYQYSETAIDNKVTGLSLEQARHELRAGFIKSWWGDVFSLSLDSRYAEVDQTETIPEGLEVTVPVPIRAGLATIDATPGLGALEENLTLIDGDLTTAADPRIEIGGANTFRNIGVDLGITRPVSALEIAVSQVSSAALVWDIYESPDNQSWFPVSGAVSRFDGGFLRYTIRFPETTNRYFKAVNLSVNAVLTVAVTEIRALVATRETDRSEAKGDEYWLNLRTNLRPSERIELALGANLRRDQNLVATDLQRKYEERSVDALLRLGLTERLELRLGHRESELEELVAPVLKRIEGVDSADLEWTPLPTVNVLLTAVQREETDGEQLINSTDTLALRALTEIFPRLSLSSTFGVSDTANTAFGFEQKTRYWIEAIEATPSDSWIFSASLSRFDYDSEGSIVVTSRTTGRLRANWFPTTQISVTAELQYGRDDLGDTLTQRYGLQWIPGAKLSLTTSYYETESGTGAGTSTATLDADYRLNRWTHIWLALLGSETSSSSLSPTTTDTVRVGFSLIL